MQPRWVSDLIGITPIRAMINGVPVAGQEQRRIVGPKPRAILKKVVDLKSPPTPQFYIQVQEFLAVGQGSPTKSFLEVLLVRNRASGKNLVGPRTRWAVAKTREAKVHPVQGGTRHEP